MLGPLLFDNNLLNMNLKNAVKQKICTGVILLGEKNQFQQEKIKIEGVAFNPKNTLNHTSGTQKSVFFNFVFCEVFLCAVSTYCKL